MKNVYKLVRSMPSGEYLHSVNDGPQWRLDLNMYNIRGVIQTDRGVIIWEDVNASLRRWNNPNYRLEIIRRKDTRANVEYCLFVVYRLLKIAIRRRTYRELSGEKSGSGRTR
jgi:hypothetical protein